ncbi:MAG TPA: hypothetical protein VNF07_05590 [Acidimicrobiales bacterium]|nr:hypothetical protein [Acidimicrobiales bacterium]
MALLALAGSAGSAFAATQVGFSVGTGPAPGSKELAAGDSYFAPTVPAGGTYAGAVVVANANRNQVSVRIYPVDGLTSPGSGSAYSNEGRALSGAGSWISISQKSLLLKANSRAVVNFTVAVPAGASPGNHLAGVAIEGASPQATTTKGNVQVSVVTRSVIAVLVTVPGAARFSVRVGPPTIKLGTYKIGTVEIPITDTGGLLGHPDLAVTLSKGSYKKTISKALETLLPGDSTVIPIFWPDALSGRYTITACAKGGGLSAPVCTSGSAVAPASAKTPTSGSGPFTKPTTAGPASSSSSSSTVLIVIIAVLGAILLGGGGILLGSRLGRRRGQGSGDDRRGQDG